MIGLQRRLISVLALGLICVACGGCAYMKDRGNDALDMFDIGFTFTQEPRVAVYGGFQSLLGVGYSDIEGYIAGIGNRHAGWLDMRYNAGGMLLEGYEQYGFEGDYDATDADSPEKRGVGLGLIYGGYPDTFIGALNCPKFVHLGFIGFNLNCKIGQVVDFVLGWTTLDIASDDHPAAGRATQ